MNLDDDAPASDHAKINHVAIRCFRDTGDADYIAARLAMRYGLPGQFLASAEQAIEKYQKCILMLNRINTEGLSHKLSKARHLIVKKLKLDIELEKEEAIFFERLDGWSFDRYLITSLFTRNEELMTLDSLVWKIRQYCRPIDMTHRSRPPDKTVIEKNISAIKAKIAGPAKGGRIPGGCLERILESKIHPGRAALVWKNKWFNNSNRKVSPIWRGFQAENAPLFNYPEVAKEAAKYMQIPDQIVRGAIQWADHKKRKKLSAETEQKTAD